MNTKKSKALLIALVCILLAGCGLIGESAPLMDANGVSIDKNGKVTQLIVEAFDQNYYNADELKGQICAQIESLGGSGDGATIRLKSFELSEDKILRVEIEFDNAQLYTDFNGRQLYAGSLSGAVAAGYSIPEMKTAEGQTLSPETLSQMGDANAVIFEEALQVVTPKKIEGISEGVSAVDPRKAVKAEEDGTLGYVIY